MYKRLGIILCCLLALGMPAAPVLATGQYYATAVGNPPSPLTLAFRTWLYTLINLRRSDVPVVRGKTEFIDPAGNDSNDGLDPNGFALTTATYSNGVITSSGSFGSFSSSFSSASGINFIYLSSATGSGFAAGLYEITAATTNTLTLNPAVDSANGTLAAPTASWTAVHSSTGPWATFSNMNTALIPGSFASINTRFRLRRNKVFYGAISGNTTTVTNAYSAAIYCAASNVTIDSYGCGQKPLITHFSSSTWQAGGWTQNTSTYTNTYFRTAPTNYVWLRELMNPLRAYDWIHSQGSDAANLTLCNSTPFSFCTVTAGSNGVSGSGTAVCINAGLNIGNQSQANPNSNYYEYNTDCYISANGTPTYGIQIVSGCDNVRIADIRLDGWGQTLPSEGQTIWGISAAAGTSAGLPQEVVISCCDAYYCGDHCIGTAVNSSTSAGCVLLDGCHAGYTTYNISSGETEFIDFYGLNSGFTSGEIIDNQCHPDYGTLPSDDWTAKNQTGSSLALLSARAAGFYSHTGGGAISLEIRNGCTINVAGEPWGCTNSVDMAVPTATTLSQVRGFVVDERMYGFACGTYTDINYPNVAVINSIYEIAPPEIPTGFNGSNGGWTWNTAVLVDGRYCANGGQSSQSQQNYSGIFAANGGSDTSYYWNDTFELRDCYAQFGFANAAGLTNIYTANCIFQGNWNRPPASTNQPGALDYYLGLSNSATYLNHNAYADIATVSGSYGYDQDPGFVTMNHLVTVGPLDDTSPLKGAGASIGLQYDANWSRRPAVPSIGPFESGAQESFIPIRSIQEGISPLY